jgi:hypothetical protein
LTRRRKIRGKKRKIKRKPNKEEGKQKSKRINVRKTIDVWKSLDFDLDVCRPNSSLGP